MAFTNKSEDGRWHHQHNAWLSYGTITAYTLSAQYHLSQRMRLPPDVNEHQLIADQLSGYLKKTMNW